MLEVLLTLGVPILAGLTLTLLRAVAGQQPLSYAATCDLALDMTFLALGAAGSVFHGARLQAKLGGDGVPGLALLIVLDLLVASVLLYWQRFPLKIANSKAAQINLALGALPVLVVGAVLYLGR
jgi:hypothetical protein